MVSIALSTNICEADSNKGHMTSFRDHYKEIISAVSAAASIAQVPESLLLSICWHESNFRRKGVTHMDGGSLSYGICQIKKDTAEGMSRLNKHLRLIVNDRNLENPIGNAIFAALYLKYQLRLYNNNWRLAADAYNKGNAVSRNSVYVNHVLKSIKFLKEKLK